jgi:hypothetical protein
VKPRTRGAALLEFAMALPFALILFIGIGDFTAYFWRLTQMEEVARSTVSKINPALAHYASMDDNTLHRSAQTLQEAVQKDFGVGGTTVLLTRGYACPLSSGGDQDLTPEPKGCKNERIYLKVASNKVVEPFLSPLRMLSFPTTAFSRHVMRIR